MKTNKKLYAITLLVILLSHDVIFCMNQNRRNQLISHKKTEEKICLICREVMNQHDQFKKLITLKCHSMHQYHRDCLVSMVLYPYSETEAYVKKCLYCQKPFKFKSEDVFDGVQLGAQTSKALLRLKDMLEEDEQIEIIQQRAAQRNVVRNIHPQLLVGKIFFYLGIQLLVCALLVPMAYHMPYPFELPFTVMIILGFIFIAMSDLLYGVPENVAL